MFYFIHGDTALPKKYDELIEKIKNENPNIETKIYDGAQNEVDLFIESISINSMFSPKELIILKRSEKYKKLDELLKIIPTFDIDQKEIIISYNEEIDIYGRLVETDKKIISKVEKLGKIITARQKTEKDSVKNYIKEELNIADWEAEKLNEILGEDFFKVKNEIQKIKNFLNNKDFNLEKVMPVLSINKEYNLKNLVENFITDNNSTLLLEYFKKNKDYMLFLRIISDELTMLLKLIELKKEGKIFENSTYNSFKGNNYDDIKKYFTLKNGYTKEYPIFLKFKYIHLFSSKFILCKLEEMMELEYKIKNDGVDEGISTEKFILKFEYDRKNEIGYN